MSLSSLQLEAFTAVAKTGSFSAAAKALHISQSALSQRIINLETELMTGLIIRDPAGLRLTPAGTDLLRYCDLKDRLESEVLHQISSGKKEPAGKLRIAGFSSVIRSTIIPIVSDLVQSYPAITVEISSRELRELAPMLARNEADLIITSRAPIDQTVESFSIGEETLVLVTSSHHNPPPGKYLDHDAEDQTTKKFFQAQGQIPNLISRHYLDEVYNLIEGVKRGLGQAVLPLHLVSSDSDLKVVEGYTSLREPVMLQYFRQPHYSQLHQVAVQAILTRVPEILGRFLSPPHPSEEND